MEIQLLPIYLPFISASQLVIVHSEHAGTVAIQNNIYILAVLIVILAISIFAVTTISTELENSIKLIIVLWLAVNIAIAAYHIKLTRNYNIKPDNTTLSIYQQQDKDETLRLFITSLIINLLFMYIVRNNS